MGHTQNIGYIDLSLKKLRITISVLVIQAFCISNIASRAENRI